jgi:dTDP-4-dehydrorhamnose 3,5-epimerase-like enzyme
MQVIVIDIGMGLLEIIPKEFGDARGFRAETWERDCFHEAGNAAS